MEFTFTPYQRLNLYNQYTILEKLSRLQNDTDDADYYAQKAKIVMEGFSYDYSECTEIIQDELPKTECKLVWDTLDMYSAILLSYQRLANPEIRVEDITFHGFDGNYEPDLLNYCKYVLFDLERFAELTADDRNDFNSHSRRREIYRAMLQKWDGMNRPYELTEAQIKELIK